MGQYCAEQIPVRYAGPGADAYLPALLVRVGAEPVRALSFLTGGGGGEGVSHMPRLDMFARRWARTAPNQFQLPQLLPIRGCTRAAIDRRLRVRFRLCASRWAGAVRLKFQLALLVPARPRIWRGQRVGPKPVGPARPCQAAHLDKPHMKAMNTASPMTTAA
jgi:hypothetical protein